jgi:catechol 2,3-dioxygenase-like lactoylglutathione lyase family enzyme
MANPMSACQVAFSVLDPDATMSWYREVFGFVASGGNADQGGPEAAAMQGLPACRCDMAWLVDKQDFFQLEFFRYHEPEPTPRRADPRPSDIGYAAVGLHVDDFDDVIRRLGKARTPLVSPVAGEAPGRRVCVRDPEGVLLEIMEDDLRHPGAGLPAVVRPDVPVAARFVRIVVEDLASARAFFVDTLGLVPAEVALHGAGHDALWLGEPPAESLTVWAGDFLVELVRYVTSRPRPDGYLISDQGLLNIALGSRVVEDYHRLVSRLGGDVTAHQEMTMDTAVVRYLTGGGGTSVEILAIPDPLIELAAGFLPRTPRTS